MLVAAPGDMCLCAHDGVTSGHQRPGGPVRPQPTDTTNSEPAVNIRPEPEPEASETDSGKRAEK